jgi:hypothetical protein
LSRQLKLHERLAGNVDEAMAGQPLWKEFLRALSGRIAELQGSAVSMPADADAIPRQEVRNAVHEASNPLTIITTTSTSSPASSRRMGTPRDLAIVGGEIERVAAILQGLGVKRETDKGAEPVLGTWVDVNQVSRAGADKRHLFLQQVNVNRSGQGSAASDQRDQLKQVLLSGEEATTMPRR